MAVRLLLGVLAPVLTDHNNQSYLERTETSEKETESILMDFQTPAKFHIGMLSISLITGLAFGGFVTYKTWMEENIFLGYVRNLIIALVCRTFFSTIFDGVILLGTPFDAAGGNTLLAFERIFLNLVLAFWLTLTIYIHGRVQRSFNSEPTLRLYQYGVPGVAVFFAFVWIFTLQDQLPDIVWWISLNPSTQWIVNSLNLLFLFIQLALTGDIVRMMMKISLDNDSVSLLRNISAMMGVLILIFWLQFGFDIGRVPLKNPTSYLYFFYFIDGLECALVCLVLYFFNKWVVTLLNKISSLMIGKEETPRRVSKPSEVLLTGRDDRRVVTIDSVFMTSESRRWNFSEEEGTKDVVYSNVVEPQRLKKTLQLYKRLNIIPVKQVTVVEGEEFYDCQLRNSLESNDCEESKSPPKQLQTPISQISKWEASREDAYFKNNKISEQTQKKNAFYSSKYLILDSKESDFPKYLETRPSVSSIPEKDNLKEGKINKNFSSSLDHLMSDDLVRKWLIENFENKQKNERNKTGNHQVRDKESREVSNHGNLDLETSKHELVSALKTESGPRQEGDQVTTPRTVVSTIGSAVSSAFCGLNKNEIRNSGKRQKIVIPDSNEIKTPVAGEQQDPTKSLGTVHWSTLEAAESQKEKAVKKSDASDDSTINTDTNSRPRKKGEILINSKNPEMNEIENTYSEFQTEDIKICEDFSNEPRHNRKSKTKLKNPEASKERPSSSIKEQTLNQTNKSKYENSLGPTMQTSYLNSVKFQSQQDQLIIDQQSQVIEKHVEKLTGFVPEKNKDDLSHNDSNLKTENENTGKSLNLENKTKKPEPVELQRHDVMAVDKTEDVEIASKPVHDSKLEPDPPSPEILMESSIAIDSIREQKSEDTVLTPTDVKNLGIKDKPTESLNEYITYSELLNFRSQREKETVNQSSKISEKFYNFSDAVSLTFDSLINASSRFLSSKKSLSEKDASLKTETSGIKKNNDDSPTNNH